MKNRVNLTAGIVILIITVLGCSSIMKGKGAGEAAVVKFHQQFNDKKFAEIYAESSPKLKEVSTEQDLNELLEAVHRKLGTFKSVANSGWHVNTDMSGTYATMNCETEFSEGKGTETFVFQIEDEKATLISYHISSKDLITK